MLTGLGGDEWFTGSDYYYADQLRQVRLLDYFRQLRDDVRGYRQFSWQKALYTSIVPLMPVPVYRIVRQVRHRRPQLPEWIDPDFARRVSLAEVCHQTFWMDKPKSLAAANLFNVATSQGVVHAREMEERYASTFNVDLRHPFLSRPIIEFGLGIPNEQRWRYATTKYVLRQALREMLPESVRLRRTKAEFSDLVATGLVALGGADVLANLQIEKQGWVLREPLLKMFANMSVLWQKHDDEYKVHTNRLWKVMSTEVWYQATFTTSS
jgi:asparagine synthase (glutamine-hydrolysing)